MSPGSLAHELPKEQTGGNGSPPADARDVLQVGQGALEQVAVLLDQRQLPEILSHGASGVHEPVQQFLVRAHHR